MKKVRENIAPSEFKNIPDIEYFNFEEDFVEENVRCIPMIVRFKMDAAGIKLKLAEWSKFNVSERIELARKPCISNKEVKDYRNYLSELIKGRTGKEATLLTIEKDPLWAHLDSVPLMLNEKLKEFGWQILPAQWKQLTNLQRFALLKLLREGHENKNLPKAMREFNLLN